ncbi:hypothetical protein ACH5RR_036867 [Cinchona calisaya]|uniref:Uncharacterized protein n=1 Tax=Cinchona calisaya TaxID=153742 RepID=A0ABD2Y5R3_9GENT
MAIAMAVVVAQSPVELFPNATNSNPGVVLAVAMTITFQGSAVACVNGMKVTVATITWAATSHRHSASLGIEEKERADIQSNFLVIHSTVLVNKPLIEGKITKVVEAATIKHCTVAVHLTMLNRISIGATEKYTDGLITEVI